MFKARWLDELLIFSHFPFKSINEGGILRQKSFYPVEFSRKEFLQNIAVVFDYTHTSYNYTNSVKIQFNKIKIMTIGIETVLTDKQLYLIKQHPELEQNLDNYHVHFSTDRLSMKIDFESIFESKTYEGLRVNFGNNPIRCSPSVKTEFAGIRGKNIAYDVFIESKAQLELYGRFDTDKDLNYDEQRKLYEKLQQSIVESITSDLQNMDLDYFKFELKTELNSGVISTQPHNPFYDQINGVMLHPSIRLGI